jgi:hypothetical protein
MVGMEGKGIRGIMGIEWGLEGKIVVWVRVRRRIFLCET